MKAFRDMSFRIKLILVFSATIAVALIIASTVLTMQSFRYSYNHIISHMKLLTEQTLLNYEIEMDAVAQQLATQINNRQIPAKMYSLCSSGPGTSGYYRQTQALTDALNQMISAQSGYDSVYVRLTNGQSFSNTYSDSRFSLMANELLSQSYGEKSYGAPQWARMSDGEIYLVRDAYTQLPFQYVGKVVAHIDATRLSSLADYNQEQQSAVVLLGSNGMAITAAGTLEEGMLQAAETAFRQNQTTCRLKQNYSVLYAQGDEWTAVGLMPMSVMNEMLRGILLSGSVVALLCAVFGALLVMLITRSMTSRMQRLVHSMDEVTAGNLDLTVPVESQDEIGQMTMHFNTMVGKTRELLERVVQEEKQKNRAEYDVLEYRYRSLQSQINPHFIYNALEVVNAMGKLSGQTEICEVVRHISAFFRRNTRNMQNRFITVQEELDSLTQYAYIYRRIYGDILSTPFSIEEGMEQALIPTMILQPVLENALVHGIRIEKAIVSLKVFRGEDGRLCLQIRDNGKGMAPEVVERILGGEGEAACRDEHSGSGVGIRNVYARLKLIYGDQLDFSIQSQLGAGTLVAISIPIMYDEKALEHQAGGAV